MTPVMQSKLYAGDAIHNGNCFAACLASLLELPLWAIPPFEDMFARSDWMERVQWWLLHMFSRTLVRIDGDSQPCKFYIASGMSARGVRHSVIYSDGQMVHDPHPSGAGIKAVEWTYHLGNPGGAVDRACDEADV